MMGSVRTLIAFARPHTIIGTSLAAVVFFLIAGASAGRFDPRVLLTVLVAGLAVNVYVVGLNQLTDIAIDRINKPWLPLAAGDLGLSAGQRIVAMAGVVALACALWQGPYLFATIAAIGLIGTVYSVPPFRLKGHPFGATAAITLARGVICNIGFYNTYAQAFGAPLGLPANVAAFVLFMVVFVTVIGLMKDVPDLDGDRAYGVTTVASRLGAGPTLRLCLGLLAIAYGAMMPAIVVMPMRMQPGIVLAGHGLGLLAIVALWRRTDPERHASTVACYKAIWWLFYLEFLIFGLASLLA